MRPFERCHAGVTRQGGAQHEQGDRRTGAFAEPHAKSEQRGHAERLHEARMPSLRRKMADTRVVERVGAKRLQRCGGGRRHHAVEKHWDTLVARGEARAEDRGEFAPTESRRGVQWIGKHIDMPRERFLDDRVLAGETRIIDAGACARETRAAAKERRRQRRRRRRVADTHLAKHDQIGRFRYRLITGGHGVKKRVLAHGRGDREIGGGFVERHGRDAQAGACLARELIDRRAARGKVRHHLRRHVGWIGGDALGRNPMIARKDQDLGVVERRRIAPLPGREPGGELFQPTKAACRLGQPPFSGRDSPGSAGIRLGKLKASGAQVVNGGKARHFGVISRTRNNDPRKLRRGIAKDFTGMGGITTDLRTGLAFCTRLPVGAPPDANLAQAAWTFPVVGVVVGVLGALAYWFASAVGLPPFVAAALAVAATALVTGCLHEDGLADIADGFGGGTTRARKLEIMRDSRNGAYGTVALLLSLLLRVGAIASLAGPGLVAAALIGAHAGARAGLPFFMRAVPNAREDGLSASAGTPSAGSASGGALLGLLVLMFFLGVGPGLLAALLVVAGLIVLARLSFSQIGGKTGDVLGAAEQISEILILLAVAALW